MAELDYYTVMQKRIEYFAKKYDPYDRLSVKEPLTPYQIPPIASKKPEKIRKKISAGYAHIISALF
jgi:hypothetical protein